MENYDKIHLKLNRMMQHMYANSKCAVVDGVGTAGGAQYENLVLSNDTEFLKFFLEMQLIMKKNHNG